MKRWLWGVLTGIILTFVVILTASLLVWSLRGRAPSVAANTTLILDMEGDVPEQVNPGISGSLFGSGETMTFLPLLRNIEKAAADKRITTLLLKPSHLQLGWSKLEQLRAALKKFEQQGKKVYALMEEGSGREYFLSSAADKVYLSPVGFLDLKGMRAEVMFFKDALAKIGVQADLEHIGKYKNFSDQFTDDKMSDAFREATTSLMDSIYGNFIATIAADRHKTPDEMRTLIEQSGPFEAERALQSGLIDRLPYEDEVFDEIKGQNPDKEIHKISMSDYSKVADPNSGGDHIAVVYAVGDITSGEDGPDPLSGKTVGAQTMAKTLEKLGEDKSVKGVILRIDSPGGDALASDEIWRDLISLRKKKPMVISMSDEAASGGYYIAMTGDPVVADPGTITGSIGIVYGKLNLKGLYDKLGVRKDIISQGKFARMDSDYGPYSPEERERVKTLMNDFYQKFLSRVSTARKMTPEDVDKLAQGRVWTGEQAKGNGLVDDLGGFPRALELIKQKAGLRADAKVELIEFPQRKSLFELIMSRAQESDEILPVGISNWLSEWKWAERISQTRLFARMPFMLSFQ